MSPAGAAAADIPDAVVQSADAAAANFAGDAALDTWCCLYSHAVALELQCADPILQKCLLQEDLTARDAGG